MSHPLNFGVQSWCFRHFKDNAKVAAMIGELGLNKVEVAGSHANFADPEEWKERMKPFADAGIEIASIGVETFSGDPAEESRFECASLAGARHISCHFQVDTFTKAIPMVREWARGYSIEVGIHCHGGFMFGGSLDELRHLISLGTPEIGLTLDTAWCLQLGPYHGKPIAWIKEFGSAISAVHYKDFTFAPNGQPSDTIVGEGNLDLPALVEALEEVGFDGVPILEYEADIENPLPALKRCVEKMRALTS